VKPPQVDTSRLQFRNIEKIAAKDVLATAILLYATPKTRERPAQPLSSIRQSSKKVCGCHASIP
jgi:hypothetical protein